MARRWALAVACLLLPAFVAASTAAPAPTARTERWEYAELYDRSLTFGPRGEDLLGRLPVRGDRGDRAPRGAADPAQPDQPPRPARPRVTVRWITADGEIEATSWAELAATLKAPAAKADATAAAHKVRVLNHLGSQGWELISVGSGSAAPWVFKRKAK
jgi:hypothetical protein